MRVVTLIASLIIGLGLHQDLFVDNLILRLIVMLTFMFAIWQDMVDYSLISRIGE